MAGHRLVNRQQPEHPVVVLAEIRLGLLGGPIVGDRRHGEERLLALVERSGRVEHRATERPHENRRPTDLERVVGQADEIAVPAERLDPTELLAAEVEDRLALRMLEGDRVEHLPDRRRVVVRHRAVLEPLRPDLAGDPDHLGPDRGELGGRLLRDGVDRHLVRSERVEQLPGEQVGAQPALPVRTGQNPFSEMAFEPGEGRPRDLCGRPETWGDGGDGRVGRLRGGRRAKRVVDELGDAGELGDRLLRVESSHRPAVVADERVARGGQDERHSLQAPGHRREAIGERRKVAGDQREDAVAEQIDPVERVPAVLPQVHLAEPVGVEHGQQEVPVGPLVGRHLGFVGRLELLAPAVVEGQPRLSAAFGQVGPAAVVVVHAGSRRGQRQEAEVLGEKRVDACGEVGHGASVEHCGWRPSYDPAVTDALRIEPVTLEGRIVRLEPLTLDHIPGLAEVGLDEEIWRWTLARPRSEADLREWAASTIAARDAGTELPFATIDAATGRPIGSSRYLNIVMEHRRLEIGWTWVAPPWQRTGANREAKLLMLEHAFDRLGCRRVEFKTDSNNEKSRTALLGIGAAFEGIFRNHMVTPGDGTRHSAWYSVIDEEWPAVRARLEASLGR